MLEVLFPLYSKIDHPISLYGGKKIIWAICKNRLKIYGDICDLFISDSLCVLPLYIYIYKVFFLILQSFLLIKK